MYLLRAQTPQIKLVTQKALFIRAVVHNSPECRLYLWSIRIKRRFMHLADAFIQSDLQVIHSVNTFFVSMCVPWELKPRHFALLTQCSTIEPLIRMYVGNRILLDCPLPFKLHQSYRPLPNFILEFNLVWSGNLRECRPLPGSTNNRNNILLNILKM